MKSCLQTQTQGACQSSVSTPILLDNLSTPDFYKQPHMALVIGSKCPHFEPKEEINEEFVYISWQF